MTNWQPIETAPKDGTDVLLYLDPPLDLSYFVGYSARAEMRTVVGWAQDSYREVVEWNCGFCEEGSADTEGYSSAFMINVTPTHWMPLPAPPESRDDR